MALKTLLKTTVKTFNREILAKCDSVFATILWLNFLYDARHQIGGQLLSGRQQHTSQKSIPYARHFWEPARVLSCFDCVFNNRKLSLIVHNYWLRVNDNAVRCRRRHGAITLASHPLLPPNAPAPGAPPVQPSSTNLVDELIPRAQLQWVSNPGFMEQWCPSIHLLPTLKHNSSWLTEQVKIILILGTKRDLNMTQKSITQSSD